MLRQYRCRDIRFISEYSARHKAEFAAVALIEALTQLIALPCIFICAGTALNSVILIVRAEPVDIPPVVPFAVAAAAAAAVYLACGKITAYISVRIGSGITGEAHRMITAAAAKRGEDTDGAEAFGSDLADIYGAAKMPEELTEARRRLLKRISSVVAYCIITLYADPLIGGIWLGIGALALIINRNNKHPVLFALLYNMIFKLLFIWPMLVLAIIGMNSWASALCSIAPFLISWETEHISAEAQETSAARLRLRSMALSDYIYEDRIKTGGNE